MVSAAAGQRRQWQLDDVGEADDRAADGDPVTLLERREDDAVVVADRRERAAADRAGASDVARRIVEHQACHDDLESARPELLAGTDDVEVQGSRRQPRVRQRVREHVAMLVGVGRVRIAETDTCAFSDERQLDIGVRVWRTGRYIMGAAEVVRDDAFVTVAPVEAEVLVDDLANPDAVTSYRGNGDLLRVESFTPATAADQAEQREHRAHHDREEDDEMTPNCKTAEHHAIVASGLAQGWLKPQI